jgi:hypothetical protein
MKAQDRNNSYNESNREELNGDYVYFSGLGSVNHLNYQSENEVVNENDSLLSIESGDLSNDATQKQRSNIKWDRKYLRIYSDKTISISSSSSSASRDDKNTNNLLFLKLLHFEVSKIDATTLNLKRIRPELLANNGMSSENNNSRESFAIFNETNDNNEQSIKSLKNKLKLFETDHYQIKFKKDKLNEWFDLIQRVKNQN